MLNAVAYLDAEVPSVHVVTEEQVARAAGGSAHLKKLHQVKELAVNITTHCTHKYRTVFEDEGKKEKGSP